MIHGRLDQVVPFHCGEVSFSFGCRDSRVHKSLTISSTIGNVQVDPLGEICRTR